MNVKFVEKILSEIFPQKSYHYTPVKGAMSPLNVEERTKSNFNALILKHTNVGLAVNARLNHRIIRHSELRIFKCDVYKKCFKLKTNIARHMKTHF